jgi:AcrR family transcriptional regulator
MGVIERRAREKDDMRRNILDSAAELFLEHGYENVSMRKIAERIEYAPSTIYLHFRDKMDIVTNLCTTTFAELDRRLQEILDLGLPPLETLRRSLRTYIDFGRAHPSHYVFVFCTPSTVFKGMEQSSGAELYGCGMGSFERLRTGLRVCMEAGVLPQADVEVTAQSTWLMIHGVTSGLILETEFPFVDHEMLIEHALDRIIAGLLAQPAAAEKHARA